MSVRFDDLTSGSEHSFGFVDPVEVLVAHSIDEIGPLIESVEAATSAGLWAAGYLAYEAAPAFDHHLQVRARDADDPFASLPLAWFGIYRKRQELDPPTRGSDLSGHSYEDWTPSTTADEYREAVRCIRRRIEQGDTYQTNYTFRLRREFAGDTEQFYRNLIVSQRGGYGAFCDTGRFQIASASPELFFDRQGDRIRVRPMKGTIRRGRWNEEDARLASQLLASEKDRAENLMIVDLLRNDLGRIAEFGSVKVPEMFVLERYGTVWQLTSEVEARLRPGVGLRQVLDALFPSGSITGAPKAITMEIISGRETTPRGVYCGAIGYIAPGGDAQFSVAIRTVVFDLESSTAEYGTGGGITWDSTPDSEYEEAALKARLLAQPPDEFDLLETLRCENGTYFFLERHLQRLADSAHYFGFRFEEDTVRTSLAKLAHSLHGAPARIRLLLTSSGDVTTETVETDLAGFVESPNAPEYREHLIRLAIASRPVDPTDHSLFHKTSARRVYDDARADHPHVDDVLLTNTDGHITESTVANVAVLIGTRWLTPPLESGCLPGVYRAELLEAGILEIASIPVASLQGATEVALINSVRGWCRAVVGDTDSPIP